MPTMANGKAVGPEQLPAELRKLGVGDNFTISCELHRIIVEI